MKPRCTPELIAEAVELKSGGMSNKDICECLLIAESTFYRWLGSPSCEAHRELGEALKKAEAEHKAALRARIFAASERDWKAAAWLLERQYPDEYGRRERREVAAEFHSFSRVDPLSASPEAVEKAEELLELLYGDGTPDAAAS